MSDNPKVFKTAGDLIGERPVDPDDSSFDIKFTLDSEDASSARMKPTLELLNSIGVMPSIETLLKKALTAKSSVQVTLVKNQLSAIKQVVEIMKVASDAVNKSSSISFDPEEGIGEIEVNLIMPDVDDKPKTKIKTKAN